MILLKEISQIYEQHLYLGQREKVFKDLGVGGEKEGDQKEKFSHERKRVHFLNSSPHEFS